MNIREMLKKAVENSDVKVFVYDRHKVDKDILFDYINQASDDELNGFMSHIRYVQGATGEMCRVAFYDDDKTLAVYGLQICKMGIEGTRKRMTDNEIIKALECCADDDSCTCKQCPYFVEKRCIDGDFEMISDALSLIRRQQAEIWRYKRVIKILENDLEIAKAGVDKQIPKKPIGKTAPMFGDVYTVCPNCGNRGLINPFNMKEFDYCPNCGQQLDWSEEE